MTTRQPKGIPVGGQFAANAHDEADGGLSDAPFSVEERASALEHDYTIAHEHENAAWLAYAFEHHSEGSDRVTITFDTEEDSDYPNLLSHDGDEEVSDSVADTVPEGWRNGTISIEKNEDGYSATIYNDDTGEEKDAAFVLDSDMDELGEDDLEIIAEDATSKRATIRDTREKLALAEAFEQASGLTGDDTMTFSPSEMSFDDGETNTPVLKYNGSFAIMPSDTWQRNAFASHGVNLNQVRVTRDADGYTIEREVTTPITQEKVWLTDKVSENSRERWKSSDL